MRHLLAAVLLLAVTLPTAALAQTETPAAADGPAFDLAAMALAPDDVPTGFFDSYDEWLVPRSGIPALLDGAVPPAGLDWLYQTFYVAPAQSTSLHVFLLAFASPEQAAVGASVVDAALRPPLPQGTTVGPAHAAGPALGDAAGTTTSVTYDSRAAGGPRVDVVAVSFRRGRLVAGVSVERSIDPPASGTPVAAVASPTAPDPVQARLASALAGRLDGRMTDVLAGRTPVGTDPALSRSILPIELLVDHPAPILGGYKSGLDLLRCGVCGKENSLLRFGDTARDGYARIVVVGPMANGEPQPPFVSVAITAYATPADARAVLAAIRRAPNDLPTPGPVPRGARTLVADPAVPGAASALAYVATSDAKNPAAPIDSAGVAFVVGDRLATVDVQGGLTPNAAMAAAIDLATQQAGCLAASAPCASATRPSAFSGGETGTPTAMHP